MGNHIEKMKLTIQLITITLILASATLAAAGTGACTAGACGYCEMKGTDKYCTVCHNNAMKGVGINRTCSGGTVIDVINMRLLTALTPQKFTALAARPDTTWIKLVLRILTNAFSATLPLATLRTKRHAQSPPLSPTALLTTHQRTSASPASPDSEELKPKNALLPYQTAVYSLTLTPQENAKIATLDTGLQLTRKNALKTSPTAPSPLKELMPLPNARPAI